MLSIVVLRIAYLVRNSTMTVKGVLVNSSCQTLTKVMPQGYFIFTRDGSPVFTPLKVSCILSWMLELLFSPFPVRFQSVFVLIFLEFGTICLQLQKVMVRDHLF